MCVCFSCVACISSPHSRLSTRARDALTAGGMSKGDLKKMMLWAADTYALPVLQEIAFAAPTAVRLLLYPL